jgi:hypothetical protein
VCGTEGGRGAPRGEKWEVGGVGGFWMGRHPRRARHRHPTAAAGEAWRVAAPYTPPPHLTATC